MARNYTSQLAVELLDRVTASARRIGQSLRDMNRNVTGTSVNMRTRLDAALTRNDAALARSRAGVMDAVGAFYTLKAAIASPIQEARDFESAMADVKKVVDFPTPTGFKEFSEELLELSTRVPLAVNGLAEIAAAAGQSGIAGDELVKFTEAAAKIGTAFDISAGDAGEALAKMKTGLGLTLDEVILLSDAMNHLSNSQAAKASEVLDVVRRVGAMGKQFGFTAQETAAFGSAMVASGAQTEVAATSFMNMGRALTRGASATKRQAAAYRQLGLEATDVAKRMQDDAVGTTIDVMERIAELPAHIRASVSSDLFGDEARALGPLLTNLDLVRESVGLVADEANYAGSSFKEFQVRVGVFDSKMKIFNNRLSALKIVIGNALIPVLSDLMDAISPVIQAIANFIEANPKLTAAVLGSAAALIALRGAFAALRFVGLMGKGGLLSTISFGLTAIGATAGRLGSAARASVALQSALAGMSGVKMTSFDKVSAGLAGMARAVPGLGAVTGIITGIVGAIGAISAPVWIAIAAAVTAVGAAWKYWDRISAIVSGVAQAVGEALQPAIEALSPILEPLQPVLDAFARGWDSVKRAIEGAVDFVRSLGGQIFTREILTPELMTMGGSGHVTPNGKMGFGGGVTISAPVTINAVPGESTEALAQRVIRLLEQQTAASLRSTFADLPLG